MATNSTLRSHSLAGCLDHIGQPKNTEQNIHEMMQACNTALPTQQMVTPQFGCTSTGTVEHQENSITTAIAGQPRWKDNRLQQISADQSHATALLAAWQKHSTGLTQKLQGAFSLAVFNTENSTLLAATDRMGQHPLYYALIDGGIVFGSSVSIVLAHPEVKRKISHQGIFDYVYFHMVPSPHSIFEGICKLPAGHQLVYSKGAVSIQNYWQPVFSESPSSTFSEMGEQLKSELKRSVQRAIDPNASVAAFLSGGLDSSSVTGMLSEASKYKAEAYSIGFSAEGYDEMEYARITAKHFGVKLNEYYVTPEDVVEALPLVAASYDEPFGNSSALPAYFCAKVAAGNGIQQLLAGDGGDELFAGNERYLKQRIFENYQRVPSFLRRGLIEPITRKLPQSFPLSRKANSYLDQANTPLPDRLQSYNFLHRHQPTEIFTDGFLPGVDTTAPIKIQRHTYHLPTNASTLNRMLYLDWQYTLADNDLHKVSHMCALAGVDVSYPMLDDELIAFSCSVPSTWKTKGNDLRHFYKKSLTGWLPHETIHKKKQGFGLPFGVWMETHKPLQEMAYDHLLKLKKRDYFRPEFIDRAIHMHRNEHAAYYGELVWILTVLEMWMNSHISE